MLVALAFLTPFGRAGTPDGRSFAYFPLVGAAIGAALGLVWWGLDAVLPHGVAAAVVVATDLGLTGMLHIDGLVDAADGLLPPHADRDRRLAVMKDPATGAFGAAAAIAVLLLRWVSLLSQPPSILLTVGIWAGSRALMAVVATTMPYARSEGGLVSAFLDPEAGDGQQPASGGSGDGTGREAEARHHRRAGRRRRRARAVAAVGGLVVAGGSLVAWHAGHGAGVLGAEMVGAALVVWLASRRLGGFTGDVLGAAGMVGETVALVVASARW
ncbi:MAG: adenosylcobinamide-GDP ribazoletransferase [Actinomycetota bacterium]|nr:adenosylcobinamide-GDP ribazoletransferase [Actinomycetota bacterium]